jgi:hypothetical protein
MAGSSTDTFPAPFDDTYGFGDIKVEEDEDVIEDRFIALTKEADTDVKQEEIPEDLMFLNRKSEPDEADIGVKQEEIPVKIYLKNPDGGEIFRTRPDRPWSPPKLLYNG